MPIKYFILAFVLAISTNVFGQFQSIKIPLKIDGVNPSSVSITIAQLGFEDQKTIGESPGKLKMLVVRSKSESNELLITIDYNNNQSLMDDKPFKIATGQKKIVVLPARAKTGKKFDREFEIFARRNDEKKTDSISIRANYSSKGLFKHQNCSIPIALIDLNADGFFGSEKFGTDFGIDRNNDGKIWGLGEKVYATEIMNFCGKNFLITNIPEDGSYLNFRRTNLHNVKLNELSPKLDFPSITGKQLSSEDLKGKPYLIDFWATWCAICIEKMPEIKHLNDALPIIYFNTDDTDRKKQALALIDRLQIAENSVLKVFPDADNFYKSYQRMQSSLPYYILIDGEGKIRYGGSGGDDLKELKQKIAELNKP